jgi:hypothetical protein
MLGPRISTIASSLGYPPEDTWFDDLVVDSVRIRCTR